MRTASNTEAALDRLLDNEVVRDIPRDEGAGMKHLTTRLEKPWRKRNSEWEYKVRFVGREYRWQEFREDLFAPGASYCTGRIVDTRPNDVCQLSLWTARMLTTRLLSWMIWWLNHPRVFESWLGGCHRRAHAERSCAQGKAHDWRIVESSRDHSCRQCVGGLLYHTQDRADAQYEVSILGSMLEKPTQGSMIALKRVTRYLKGTRHFVNKLELDGDVDKHVARRDGFSDSD